MKRKTMDGQFNTLLQSYHDNYVQYKITGAQATQNAYLSADQGLQTILSSLQKQVADQTATISTFYKSGVEEKVRDTQADMKKYQRKIVQTGDQIEAANLRAEAVPGSPPQQLPLISQYIALATLGVIAFGLMAMQ